MATEFFEISKKIVDRFLQTIVFIDEKAYKVEERGQQSFDAKEVSDSFAKANKICSIFAPQTEADIKASSLMIQNADCVVLDWWIDIEPELGEGNDEEDDDVDDIRGKYTINMVKKIVASAGTDQTKLVVIYTGETDLIKVRKKIAESLHGMDFQQDQELRLFNNNICITIRSKKYGDANQFEHTPELQPYVCAYENLPDLIISEFARFTYGLLPNFALASIASIRENSSKILGVFSKDLDPAYIYHRNMIPNHNDAKCLMAEIFGTAISELIESNKQIDLEQWLNPWADDALDNGDKNIVFNDVTKKNQIETKEVPVNKETLKRIISNPSGKWYEGIMDCQNHKYDKANKHMIGFLCLKGENEVLTNFKFAQLTQNRNLFAPNNVAPILTLGTVIKDCNNNYKICVQPACDCARIKKEGRHFLFLPVSVNEKEGIPIALEDNIIGFVDTHPYNIVSFIFQPQEEDHPVSAIIENDKFVFRSVISSYQWITTLKSLYAQRIVEACSSQLSRVGLDMSEWMRIQK